MPRYRAGFCLIWLVFLCSILSGCGGNSLPQPEEENPRRDIGSLFDPENTGSIAGQVKWVGKIPSSEPNFSRPSPLTHELGNNLLKRNNPNNPIIDPATSGVERAVVFLKGVDPRRGRMWDWGKARIEITDDHFQVVQGKDKQPFGLVLRGTRVEMVSKQKKFHSLQARGVSFFARTFPNAEEPCSAVLDRIGVVEMSSGAGYFWMRAYLFVDDHPYYSFTKSAGSFALNQVPPGEYELICWHPNWREKLRKHDGDTKMIARIVYQPPLEKIQKVFVHKGQTTRADFTLNETFP